MSALMKSNGMKSQLDQVNAQVDDVLNVMKENTKRILDRGHRLNELFERAEALEKQATIFVKTTTHIKKKAKFRAAKWTLILAGIIVICIAVISAILFG
jgi:vesicle-associated membrane protein 3